MIKKFASSRIWNPTGVSAASDVVTISKITSEVTKNDAIYTTVN